MDDELRSVRCQILTDSRLFRRWADRRSRSMDKSDRVRLKPSTFGRNIRPNIPLLGVLLSIGFTGALQTTSAGKSTPPGRAPTPPPPEILRQEGTLGGGARNTLPACPPWSPSPEPPASRAIGGHRVILSWTASTPADAKHAAAVGYCVYRGVAPDDPSPVRINSVAFQGTSCTDDLVRNGEKYYYKVRAISARANTSDASNGAFAQIPDSKPSTPGRNAPPLCREPASMTRP